jgi:hypothetical protein
MCIPGPWSEPFWESEWVLYTKIDSSTTCKHHFVTDLHNLLLRLHGNSVQKDVQGSLKLIIVLGLLASSKQASMSPMSCCRLWLELSHLIDKNLSIGE